MGLYPGWSCKPPKDAENLSRQPAPQHRENLFLQYSLSLSSFHFTLIIISHSPATVNCLAPSSRPPPHRAVCLPPGSPPPRATSSPDAQAPLPQPLLTSAAQGPVLNLLRFTSVLPRGRDTRAPQTVGLKILQDLITPERLAAPSISPVEAEAHSRSPSPHSAQLP